MLASAVVTPGACPTVLDWNATTAASGQSVLSGVLAGFVFGGIVVVLSTRREDKAGKEAGRALKLLLSAFFGLVVTAYLFADQAGDTTCLRAQSEEVLAGGLLGTFAIIMIVSLTWLVVAYGLYADGVLRFLRGLIYFASAFVVLLLCTSSYTYLDAVLPHGTSGGMIVGLFVTGGLIWLAAVPAGSRTVAWLAAWAGRWPALTNRGAGLTAGARRKVRGGPVDWCAWSALGYLAAASFADAFVLAVPASAWDHPVPPASYAVAWSSLVIPLAVLVLALRALASDAELDSAQGDTSQAPADPQAPAEGAGTDRGHGPRSAALPRGSGPRSRL
jgi:hypothetical protein